MVIKHLVIPGGGHTLFQTIGAIKHIETEKLYNIHDIETIYATSAGAIISTILCLKYDWETVLDYIVNRPWKDVFDINIHALFDIYYKKGVYNITTFEKCLKPLFDAKDVALDITMTEFYHLSKIELHFFSFEINSFEIVDISYKTHPSLSLLTALQMTCALPVLITPVCINDKCYIDGGIVYNYPLCKIIESGKDPKEIIGFKNQYGNSEPPKMSIETNMFDYILGFLTKLIYNLNKEKEYISNIQHEIICNTELMNMSLLTSILNSSEKRKSLVNKGIQDATEFMTTTHLQNGI
jgi:predicted acylesterase/phospholipase RssA